MKSDGVENRGAAKAAAAWARQYRVSEQTFLAAVTGEQSREFEFARVWLRGRRRRIVRRTAPTASRVRKLDPPADPALFNPWEVDSRDLAKITRHLIQCPTCDGDKQVICGTCRGSVEVDCGHCGGNGSVPSSRTGRWIQCRRCRGDGLRRCPCRDGLRRCEPCIGRGKVEEFLEVEETPFTHLQTSGANELAQAFSTNGRSSPDTRTSSLEPTLHWRGTASEDPPGEVQALLDRSELRTRLDPIEDRVEIREAELFRSSISTLSYQLFGARGDLEIENWSGRVWDGGGGRRPIRRWRAVLAGAGASSALLGLGWAAWYTARHPYFSTTVMPWLLLLAALVLPLAIVPLVARLATPPGARRVPRSRQPALLAALILAFQASAVLAGNPSLDTVRSLQAKGEHDRARLAAAACIELGIDPAGASSLHDDSALLAVRAARSVEAVWTRAVGTFYTDRARLEAAKHALALTEQQVRRFLSAADLLQAEKVLGAVPPEMKTDQKIRALRSDFHLAAIQECSSMNGTRCLEERFTRAKTSNLEEVELESLRAAVREIALPEALEHWQRIRSGDSAAGLEACSKIETSLRALEVTNSVEWSYPMSRSGIETRCNTLEQFRLAEVERRKQATAQARQREQRLISQRLAQANRSWARAPLLCRDGTLSPSCVCGQGSKQGCCSHHGGVAGCSQAR